MEVGYVWQHSPALVVGETLNQRTAPNRELLTTTNFWRPLQNSLVLQVLLYNAAFSGLIISYGFVEMLGFFENAFWLAVSLRAFPCPPTCSPPPGSICHCLAGKYE